MGASANNKNRSYRKGPESIGSILFQLFQVCRVLSGKYEMSKGYLFAFIQVHDPSGFRAYQEAVGPILARYGGKLLVKTPEAQVRESSNGAIANGSVSVVIEFDSFDAATAFYESTAYQSIIKLREPHSDATFVLVPGVE